RLGEIPKDRPSSDAAALDDALAAAEIAHDRAAEAARTTLAAREAAEAVVRETEITAQAADRELETGREELKSARATLAVRLADAGEAADRARLAHEVRAAIEATDVTLASLSEQLAALGADTI